ncbi:SCY1-like protein 2 [Liparis tanakae]|uniref:SCY1-like protein 2 n=1 Tax=Liparis tanakae TaxID=230148 RepID=A0A4Z2EII7_9TELE|nr:SCY1-like protein 2 [Liparis tanakae]
MVPFVLPNVLLIAEECTKEEYVRLIMPDLTPVFKQQEPIQASNMILLIFLQKMDLLLTKTPSEDIKNNVLPMVRVNSLVCLGKILEYLDKWFVLEEILPFLQQIPSREPAVLMGILGKDGIYKCTFSHKKLGIPKDHLATKSLPHLVSLSIDNNLNLNQFNSFMAVIRDMLSRMEAEHKTKLEQLHVMQEQQRSINISNPGGPSEKSPSPPSSRSQMDDMFGSSGVNGKENGSAAPQPNRMSLTLEEKQRLAKEQEQAAKLRNQQPLAPQSIRPANAANAKTKDLTSSLLSMASLSGMSLANAARPAAAVSTFPSSGAMMGSMGANPVSNGFNAPMGFQAGGMGMGMRPAGPGLYGGMATATSTPNFGALAQSQGAVGHANKTPDLSALDSLFTSNQTKVTLSQMGPKAAPGGGSPWLGQYGAGPNAQTAMQMQGAAPGPMGGAPSGFGMQANPFFSPQNFSQAGGAAPNQSGIKHSASVNNDLKDLFG